MPYTEIDTELLLLAANDSARDRKECADRLSDMSAEELRQLREAVSQLDAQIDAEMLQRHINRK